jgi:hypothetical protein
MSRVFFGLLAALALSLGSLLPSPASAVAVSWDIDPTLSNFRLAIPDQSVTLGTVTATMRLRNQNNAAWTTNNAPVDGLLATNVGFGGINPNSVQFLAGASSLVGVNTGNYRPNPAVYNTAVTSTINTAGSFTATSSAQAVYAARVNAFNILSFNTGYVAFSNVQYDLSSAVIGMSGTSFLSNSVGLGIVDSTVAFDGIEAPLVGQVVPDTLAQTGPISATNTNGAAGSIVLVSGNLYRITIPINMPVNVNLQGIILTATATGTLVGFATIIPEPGTLALVAAGILGLAIQGRKRHA